MTNALGMVNFKAISRGADMDQKFNTCAGRQSGSVLIVNVSYSAFIGSSTEGQTATCAAAFGFP